MISRSIIAIVFVLFFGFCSLVSAQDVSQQMDGFNLQGYADDGKKAWDVSGQTADVQGDDILVTDVDANHYGEQQTNLKARNGVINRASGDVHLENDVVITTDKGSQLKTNSLDWKKEDKVVSTEDQAVITDQGVIVTGQGLEAQVDMEGAQLNRDVEIQLETQKDENALPEKMVITSRGPMELYQASHKTVLKDDVVAVRGDQRLQADRIEVFLDEQTRKIDRLICIGNVAITQGENVSYSDRAIYNANTGMVTLTGRPKLILMTEWGEDFGGLTQ